MICHRFLKSCLARLDARLAKKWGRIRLELELRAEANQDLINSRWGSTYLGRTVSPWESSTTGRPVLGSAGLGRAMCTILSDKYLSLDPREVFALEGDFPADLTSAGDE